MRVMLYVKNQPNCFQSMAFRAEQLLLMVVTNLEAIVTSWKAKGSHYSKILSCQNNIKVRKTAAMAYSCYRVEWHIIFAHKLKQFYVIRILPPLLPIRCIGGRNRNIADGCIKPNIEHLKIIRMRKPDNLVNAEMQNFYAQTLSLYFSCGTGTPHLRSLVMQRGFSPSLSHAFVAWIAFWLHKPVTEVSSM